MNLPPKLLPTNSRPADSYRMLVVETMSPLVADIDKVFEIVNVNLSADWWEKRALKNPVATFEELVRGCRT